MTTVAAAGAAVGVVLAGLVPLAEDAAVSGGPEVDAFEEEMATRVGVGHALAVSSGTAALHLALLRAGDSIVIGATPRQ